MQDFSNRIERLLEEGRRRLNELSEHWETHTNRRTILAVVFCGALLLTLYVSVIEPPGNFPLNTLVTIPPGATLSEAAETLESSAIVRSGAAFALLMRATGRERAVHAGDYLFENPENLFGVARAVALGNYGLEPIRIRAPEGAMTHEMASLFGRMLQRFDEERFLAAARPLEGYLFPDTYFFMPNATDGEVVAAMYQSFERHIESLRNEIAAFGRPLEDVIVMASLLEREAKDFEDRRMIAGVLWNRLERDMLLQVDAAFLYSLGKGTFDLTVSDLANEDDPYNTYKHKGLPPTPIGSPSLDAILAAVTPIEHSYFFYLADGEGTTHYSRTFEEHVEKKRRYLGS